MGSNATFEASIAYVTVSKTPRKVRGYPSVSANLCWNAAKRNPWFTYASECFEFSRGVGDELGF